MEWNNIYGVLNSGMSCAENKVQFISHVSIHQLIEHWKRKARLVREV